MDAIEKYFHNLYRVRPDFLYSVSRDFIKNCRTPMLVLPDDTPAHPLQTSIDVASLAPNAEITVFPWREPPDLKERTISRVRAELRQDLLDRAADALDTVRVRGDRLVHPDQPHLLADARHREHLIGRNHLRVVPSRCRRSGFAVFQAFERDNNAIGLQQDLARFHGGPWSQNLPADENRECRSSALHCHMASARAYGEAGSAAVRWQLDTGSSAR